MSGLTQEEGLSVQCLELRRTHCTPVWSFEHWSRACQGPVDEGSGSFPVLSEEGLWGTGDGHPCWVIYQQALRGWM